MFFSSPVFLSLAPHGLDGGFFDLSHVFDGPLLYGESSRFDAMPSSPNRQACSNTAGPSCARCSLYVIAVPTRASHLRETLLAVSGAGHLANGSKGGVVFALKLRFDSGLVYDRPFFLDPAVSKFIEYVFGKRDSLPVYMEAKQDSLWRAVEAKTARYTR